jgi:hypothetical protein
MKLYPNTSPKGFDFTGKDRSNQAVELLGIYSFDSPDLMIRYRIHHPDDAAPTPRPDFSARFLQAQTKCRAGMAATPPSNQGMSQRMCDPSDWPGREYQELNCRRGNWPAQS